MKSFHIPSHQKIGSAPWLIAALSATALSATAHIGYSGRDFGNFTGLSDSSVTIANQAVTGNFGWADAADGNLGDSHHSRAFRFHLDNQALVSITFEANATATATSLGGLIPGISLYQGLAATSPFAPTQTDLPSSADHDESSASEVWRTQWAKDNLGVAYDSSATGGDWNALGAWKIGGDGDLPGDTSQLSSFVFKGFGVDFDLDGRATVTRVLDPGDYSIFVGGNDLANMTSANADSPYGLRGIVSVTQVPEPGTWALVILGAATLATRRSAKRG
ncbi:MAG: PEP-CTERM sorting domain-containing protein [Verrucomicrobiales bacterium]|nr:PEP-CTERM sorting domain-containing protein [Verrucomicrobiales bacterium]